MAAYTYDRKRTQIDRSGWKSMESKAGSVPSIDNSVMNDLIGASDSTPHTESLSQAMQARMRSKFNLSFQDVRVHYNSREPESLQARAFAKGNDIHIAPHEDTQELLEHELTHVAQQRRGIVSATGSAGGMAINDDAALEHSADLGAMPASGGAEGGAPFGSVAQLCPKGKKTNEKKTGQGTFQNAARQLIYESFDSQGFLRAGQPKINYYTPKIRTLDELSPEERKKLEYRYLSPLKKSGEITKQALPTIPEEDEE